MKNMLLSAAIGDISGMPYEFSGRTKNYDAVNLLNPYNDYTDDTVCTFACAEALLKGKDMAECLHKRGREDFGRGFGGMFAHWLCAPNVTPPYNSYGNGSAMRVSAAGFLATSEQECIYMATKTALPTHNHPEGIKGAVATALAIFWAKEGKDKNYIRENILNKYYPEWAQRTYQQIKPGYHFDETCQQTVPAALICFLESKDYEDCLKLAISLGGDADTLAAITGPIAYAHYKHMPEILIKNALSKLPQWMHSLNKEFDEHVNSKGAGIDLQAHERTYNGTERPQFTPLLIRSLKEDEIFVFGSNLAGMHGGGAARTAYNHFGAEWGQGVGLQGQSYAIPTMHGGVDSIKPYVDQFIEFARNNKDKFFYVTRIGCGIAGFKDEEIAPLFAEAIKEENICLPETFINCYKKTTTSNTDLNRFLEAQAFMYETALAEIRNGHKNSHWIWYIFPQLAGLGHSANSKYYGIKGIEEAKEYLHHPILGSRLKEITTALLSHSDKSAKAILGSIDAMKLHSSMTLFNEIAKDDIYKQTLDTFFQGRKDKNTISLLV